MFDVGVVSWGGVGTTQFMQNLAKFGIKSNHEGDADLLKHTPDPNKFKNKTKKIIYLHDCPILANKSHFRRKWFRAQAIKVAGKPNTISKNYTWDQFIKNNIDWFEMEKHWDNWYNSDFEIMFLRLSTAYKHNKDISEFLGLKETNCFFVMRERQCKLTNTDVMTVYDSLVEKQNKMGECTIKK